MFRLLADRIVRSCSQPSCFTIFSTEHGRCLNRKKVFSLATKGSSVKENASKRFSHHVNAHGSTVVIVLCFGLRFDQQETENRAY